MTLVNQLDIKAGESAPSQERDLNRERTHNDNATQNNLISLPLDEDPLLQPLLIASLYPQLCNNHDT